MKNIFRLSLLVASCLALATFSSCSNEELDTDQFVSKEVALNVYGPQPVVRGGVLRFIGSNLDRIKSIDLPGVGAITDIEVVQAGVPSEIRITVPKDGPVPGFVTLTADDGKQITTKTQLTFSEPITLDSVSPLDVYPGDEITIKGDYLNLIHEVIFSEEVLVSENDFVSHDRYSIVVKVPVKAISGPVGIGDVDEINLPEDSKVIPNVILSEQELKVGTATFTSISAEGGYKAGNLVTIKGTHLDLVEAVDFQGATVTEFKSHTSGVITLVLPAEAKDGEVLLTQESKVQISAGSIETVVPTDLKAAPSPVKAGETVTISGKDLDLVTGVTTTGGDWAEFNYADGVITFTVAEAVVDDDPIVLHLANGKTVDVPFTLVVPTAEAVSPADITAGESFTVTGKDLDLVVKVLVGDSECTDVNASEGEVTATTLPTTATGKIILVLANGKKIETDLTLNVTAAGKIQVFSLPSSASVGDEITMEGEGFNLIEAIYFGDVKVTGYSLRSADKMVFTIPVDLEPGVYAPRFVLTTGEEETCTMSIEVKGKTATVVLLDSAHDLGLTWSNPFTVPGNVMDKVPFNATFHIEYSTPETSEPWYQLQLCYNTSGWPKLEVMNGQDVISVDQGSSSFTAVLSKNDLHNIWQYGLVVAGHAVVLEKIFFTYDVTSYDPVFVSDVVLVDWDDHGGHNGDWDGSWSGISEFGDRYGDGKDKYIRSNKDSEGEAWFVCCNHQSSYTEGVWGWSIEDASQYVIKFDVMIEDGASSMDAAAAEMQYVLGDSWYWYGAGFFPSTTGGEWITVTRNLSDLGISGALDCSSGTNGCYGKGIPAGINIDNFRLAKK